MHIFALFRPVAQDGFFMSLLSVWLSAELQVATFGSSYILTHLSSVTLSPRKTSRLGSSAEALRSEGIRVELCSAPYRENYHSNQEGDGSRLRLTRSGGASDFPMPWYYYSPNAGIRYIRYRRETAAMRGRGGAPDLSKLVVHDSFRGTSRWPTGGGTRPVAAHSRRDRAGDQSRSSPGGRRR